MKPAPPAGGTKPHAGAPGGRGRKPQPATSGDTSAQGRLVKQRFSLQNRKYRASERYYLVLQDAGDAIAQPQKQEFTIDIAFADDFGFRV